MHRTIAPAASWHLLHVTYLMNQLPGPGLGEQIFHILRHLVGTPDVVDSAHCGFVEGNL